MRNRDKVADAEAEECGLNCDFLERSLIWVKSSLVCPTSLVPRLTVEWVGEPDQCPTDKFPVIIAGEDGGSGPVVRQRQRSLS